MYTYSLTIEADSDLSSIFDYTVEKWGEKQALKYIADLKEAILMLCDNPKIAKFRTDLSNNTFSFPVLQHVVYFDLFDETLIIWAIHHKSRLPFQEARLY